MKDDTSIHSNYGNKILQNRYFHIDNFFVFYINEFNFNYYLIVYKKYFLMYCF